MPAPVRSIGLSAGEAFVARELSVASSVSCSSTPDRPLSTPSPSASPLKKFGIDWLGIHIRCAAVCLLHVPVWLVSLGMLLSTETSFAFHVAAVTLASLIGSLTAALLLRAWVVLPLTQNVLGEMERVELGAKTQSSNLNLFNSSAYEVHSSITEFRQSSVLLGRVVQAVARESVRQMMRINFHTWRNSLHGHLMALAELRVRLSHLHSDLGAGVLQLSASHLLSDTVEMADIAEVAECTANDIRRSLKRVLTLQDLQDGGLRLKQKPFCMDRLVARLGEVFKVACEEKHISLTLPQVSVMPSLDEVVRAALSVPCWSALPFVRDQAEVLAVAPRMECRVVGDSWLLLQCMIQLLRNSVKHSRTGSCIQVRCHFRDFVGCAPHATQLSSSRRHQQCILGAVTLEVEVEDEGVSISAAKRSEVCGILSGANRVDHTSVLDANRQGLGLRICHAIIQKHGGVIKCQSPCDQVGDCERGTRVTWSFRAPVELVRIRDRDAGLAASSTVNLESLTETPPGRASTQKHSGFVCVQCSRGGSGGGASASETRMEDSVAVTGSSTDASLLVACSPKYRNLLHQSEPLRTLPAFRRLRQIHSNLALGDGVLGVEVGQYSPDVVNLAEAAAAYPEPQVFQSTSPSPSPPMSPLQELLLGNADVPRTNPDCVDTATSSDFIDTRPTDLIQTPKPVRLKVLVVDDDPICRKMMLMSLKRLNCCVSEASDGQACLDCVESLGHTFFDLILMDGSMEPMNGVQATRELRRRGVNTPIVALTANESDADRVAFLQAGARQVCYKPMSRQQLVGLLKSASL